MQYPRSPPAEGRREMRWDTGGGLLGILVLCGIGTGALGVFFTATPQQRWIAIGLFTACILALYAYRKWEDMQHG
jgi:hypothetical protein